ncbi:MAG: hypothetical protein WC928_04300 [Patescibacteria group bacterium]|jgi:hypothetical protein
MKNFPNFCFKVVNVLIIPAIFSVLIYFAFHQVFSVGLATLIISILILSFVRVKIEYSEWDYFCSDGVPSSKREWNNLIVNLTMFSLIVSVLVWVFINFRPTFQLNLLGSVISIGITVLIFLFFLLKKGVYYFSGKVRLLLSLTLIFVFIFFLFSFFQTQFIWLVPFLLVVFSVFGGLSEISDKIKKEVQTVSSFLFGLVVGYSIISTIIQFWNEISNFMWRGISAICTIIGWFIKLLSSPAIFSFIVGEILALLVLIALFSFVFIRKIRKYRIEKRKQEEAVLQQKAEEERNLELAKMRRKIEEKNASLLEALINGNKICKEEIMFLSKNSNYLSLSDVSVENFLSSIDWNSFFTISQIKKQIVWESNLSEVLKLINNIYSQSYIDSELEALQKSVEDLLSVVRGLEGFKGFEEFLGFFKGFNTKIAYKL